MVLERQLLFITKNLSPSIPTEDIHSVFYFYFINLEARLLLYTNLNLFFCFCCFMLQKYFFCNSHTHLKGLFFITNMNKVYIF